MGGFVSASFRHRPPQFGRCWDSHPFRLQPTMESYRPLPATQDQCQACRPSALHHTRSSRSRCSPLQVQLASQHFNPLPSSQMMDTPTTPRHLSHLPLPPPRSLHRYRLSRPPPKPGPNALWTASFNKHATPYGFPGGSRW